ncbi:Peptidase S46 [Proteiniphilum saccharofermentans]|uniref:Dipeptidyl-peptidase n=1 Tax=Proteiniphilum saccharofermentans TaxID=1642647 RepID=A0A1R3TB00_9BACT|nr:MULTISPECIES: S46 family peptidase [Proteiniphilum]MDY9919297.1 S46 family peptidase [Proteiniphilum sp.]SCD20774.1 Peptidase S46 [Proteiniphilum saccharofermentans]SEA05338.1 Peptidase S46 [Porphyromonadaceae bacterium KH3R12]
MKKVGLLVAIFLATLTVKADEGMWLLKELNSESVARMKELGFTFPVDQLYDEDNPSLKDAVVIFGGGCTGVAVSDQGLIFTNHHCGYGAIQKLSAVEHDYLKDGFVAENQAEELPADGLTVSFLKSMTDVTDRIMAHVPSVLSEIQRERAIDSLSTALIDEYETDPFTHARIVPFYSRNKYYVVLYDQFRDVRLVTAPPSSVGKFGGDTDNWMWPRHTGDFSVFRVYADKDNRPANYSSENVPYQPKYVVPVSLDGVTDGDYAMTIGYPGSTQRYMSSWGIRQRMESENKPRIEVRGAKQDIWWDAMTKNDTIRIKYANKYAGSSNYWKNSMGMNEALTNLEVLPEKEKLEARLKEWIKGSPVRQARYGSTLSTLESAYTDSGDLALYTTYFLEVFNNGIELIRFANTILQFDSDGTEEDKQDFINDRFIESYKNYEPALDKKVLPTLMKLYAERVPEQYHPDIYQKVKDEFGGDYEQYADWLFANSRFTSLEELLELLKTADTQSLTQDPAMELALSTADMGYELSGQMMSYYEKMLRGEREFMAALMEMDADKTFYPDANFTQRMSYGTVGGYQPRDAVWYDYYTTSQGILEKQKPGDPEFNVQEYILDAIRSGDFDRYGDPEGLMRVNVLSNNDITGGNSGSPVLNGNAELIGLAFDGNWESLSGDILFEPEMQRVISVDIRYVLYMIDKVMGASHVIDELKVVGK